MMFTRRLRERVRSGRIKCSVRIWMRPHVKVGGRYPMDEGHIVVDSILPIRLADVTSDLARESGFSSVKDLLGVAKHGRGDKPYLIRFHFLPPGAWDVPRPAGEDRREEPSEARSLSPARIRSDLLRRIRDSRPAAAALPLRAGRQRKTMPKPTTIAEYISAAPKHAQKPLRELYAILKKVAPDATEGVKWGSPVFEDTRILFAFAAFKSHLGFMPTPSAMKPFKKELAAYTTGKASIQLPYDKRLPKTLIRKIAALRVKELREKDVRWM